MHNETDYAALRAELAHPGALEHAERRAKAAMDAARARGRLAIGNMAAIHEHAVATLTRQRPQPNPQSLAEVALVAAFNVARLRHAIASHAAFQWLAGLSDQLLAPASVATGEDRPKATRALCQQHEAWAAWSAAFDAECARIDEANARSAAASAAAFRAAAPAKALAAAEADGVVLKLDAAGENITAPAAHNISEAVLTELRQHKAAVLALLAKRAARVVVA